MTHTLKYIEIIYFYQVRWAVISILTDKSKDLSDVVLEIETINCNDAA